MHPLKYLLYNMLPNTNLYQQNSLLHPRFTKLVRSNNTKIDGKHLVKCISILYGSNLSKKQMRIHFQSLPSQQKENILKMNNKGVVNSNKTSQNVFNFQSKPTANNNLFNGNATGNVFSINTPKANNLFANTIPNQSSFFNQVTNNTTFGYGQTTQPQPTAFFRQVMENQSNNVFNTPSFNNISPNQPLFKTENSINPKSKSQRFFQQFHKLQKQNSQQVLGLYETKQIQIAIQAFFKTSMMQQAMLSSNQRMVSAQNYHKAIEQTKQIILKQRKQLGWQ